MKISKAETEWMQPGAFQDQGEQGRSGKGRHERESGEIRVLNDRLQRMAVKQRERERDSRQGSSRGWRAEKLVRSIRSLV